MPSEAQTRRALHAPSAPAFTLVELLVVMLLIAVLGGLLVPGLRRARDNARSVACAANLRALMGGIHAYAADNDALVVPSYNMHGVSGSTANPFDGWGPILDRDGFVRGSDQLRQNPFVCPLTRDIRGVAFDRAGTPARHAEGYMDWPAAVTIFGDYPRPLPSRGFHRIIRVAYWINGDNPNGLPGEFTPDLYFTASVGYGPSPSGKTMRANNFAHLRKPAQLVALADGFYAGSQQATRPQQSKRRIGYRHQPGGKPAANVAMADGHAEGLPGERFPRGAEDDSAAEEARADNLGAGPTLYADPLRDLARASVD